MLKLITSPEFHQSLTVKDVEQCDHISCDTPERVWVSDGEQFILTNTSGETLNRLFDLGGVFLNHLFVFSPVQEKHFSFGSGLHSLNSENELIYIDRIGHINILPKDIKTSI